MVQAGADVAQRNDVSVKIDADAARLAKTVATYQGKSLSEYLTAIVQDATARDWREIVRAEQAVAEAAEVAADEPATKPKRAGKAK